MHVKGILGSTLKRGAGNTTHRSHYFFSFLFALARSSLRQFVEGAWKERGRYFCNEIWFPE